MSLAPQPRLLGALLLGALSVLLVLLSPVFWLLVIGYHVALIALVVVDAQRLPSRRGFAASRVLPQPFSLGETQAVQVVVGHAQAAGLPAEVADHVPADLGPNARVLRGAFDREGFLTVEYLVQPPHRGAYRFGPVDVHCWRPVWLADAPGADPR